MKIHQAIATFLSFRMAKIVLVVDLLELKTALTRRLFQ